MIHSGVNGNATIPAGVRNAAPRINLAQHSILGKVPDCSPPIPAPSNITPVKGSDRDEVLRAIRAVAAGDAIFSSGVADRLAALLADEPVAPRAFPNLTERERQVLEQVARGLTNSEIASELGISLKTVRNNVSNIFTKLEVSGRAQAVVRARDAGMVRP